MPVTVAHMTSPSALPAWPYPRWIAHRGAGLLAPENTLAAFRLGASWGYRMFECDVKLSSDDVPFLLHDDTLERTTSPGAGAHPSAPPPDAIAGAHPWRQLAALDAGQWHSRDFAGEALPTLAQISRFCRAGGHCLNIEIKPTTGTALHTGAVVAAQAHALWQGAPVPPLLSSFEVEALQGARLSAPGLPRALLLDTLWEGWLPAALDLQCVALVCNYTLWTRQTVAQAKAAGLRCLSYTVNDEAAAAQLVAWETDGIITDRVDHFRPDVPSAT